MKFYVTVENAGIVKYNDKDRKNTQICIAGLLQKGRTEQKNTEIRSKIKKIYAKE